MRAVGIEPLEYFLQGIRPDAGTVIIDMELSVASLVSYASGAAA